MIDKVLVFIGDFLNEHKKQILNCLLCFSIIMLSFFCGYLLGSRRISDDGTGNANVEQQLNQIGTDISSAGNGIAKAEKHIDNAKSGIGIITESVEYQQNIIAGSREIIADCKCILEKIRSRGKIKTDEN